MGDVQFSKFGRGELSGAFHNIFRTKQGPVKLFDVSLRDEVDFMALDRNSLLVKSIDIW